MGMEVVPDRRHIRAALLTLLLVTAAGSARAQVVYVDDTATGSGDGSTWCDAYVHLQDALSAARDAGGAVNEIRVAAGEYKPDRGEGQTLRDRAATFELINGVTLDGGYAGCNAIEPDARDIAVHETVLSGDLAGNDVGERWDPSRYENSYHVVSGVGTDASACLDGFIIISGRADGNDPDDSGAGLYNDRGSPTVIDCTFSDHWAYDSGGALYNTNLSHPTLTRCIFRGNSGDYGGAIANDNGSSPDLIDCVLTGNTVGYHGGGVYNSSDSIATLTGCSLIANIAYYSGGAMYSTDGSGPQLSNCLITDNEARNGGGLFSSDGAVPLLVFCTLGGNTARFGGGGLFNKSVTARLTNCILRGNAHGGVIDESAQIYSSDGTLPVVSHSCIQGWTGDLGGSGNMGLDPLFVPGPAGCYYLSQIEAGEAVNSPCVDTGSGAAAGTVIETRTTQSGEGLDTTTGDMGYHYPVTNRPLVMGDYDRDGSVTLADFAGWTDCATGPQPADVSPCCRIFDFDSDGDSDLKDLADLQRVWAGRE